MLMRKLWQLQKRGDLVDVFLCHGTQRATTMQQVIESEQLTRTT